MTSIYGKSSFDRFGDDLIELVLSYISFEDSFHFRGVSKQWKRLVFNKQNKLIVKLDENSRIHFMNDSFNEFNLKVFQLVLKNCRKITSIYFEYNYNLFGNKTVVNINTLFDLIINYCNNLSEIFISFKSKNFTQNTINKFGQKFGLKLKRLYLQSVYNYNNNYKIIKFCPNLTHLWVSRLKCAFDGNQVLCKKLKYFEFNYSSKDRTRIDSFIESNKNSLKVFSINFEDEEDVNENDFNVLFNSLSKLTKLKSFLFNLKLKEIDISLIKKFKKFTKNCKLLKRLYLYLVFNNIEVFEFFFQSINEIKSLETLSLDFDFEENDINFTITSELFNKLENLKHLQIQRSFLNENVILISDQFFESIDKHLPKLQSFECNTTDITEKSFKCLSKLPELQSIKLEFDSEFKFNDSDVKELIKNNKTINNIYICNNSLEIDLNDENIFDLRNGKDFNILVKLNNNSSRL